MTSFKPVIRVGTRGSALALEQTRRVVDALRAAAPNISMQTQIITTSGDVDKQTSLTILGGQGIFAQELQAALLRGEIDIAVHSAKDLTSELAPGLILGAIPERENPQDVLISRDGRGLDDLPAGARIGTSSRRRVIQLKTVRPDLEPVELRGNVDTRLRKVREGQVDAAILAAAGISRMGWTDRITQYLPLDSFVPAPGQGAIGIECRADNTEVVKLLQEINHPTAAAAVTIERAFLRAIGGGCTSPIGAYAEVAGDQIDLRVMFGDEDLTVAIFERQTTTAEQAGDVAISLAQQMKERVEQRTAVFRQ